MKNINPETDKNIVARVTMQQISVRRRSKINVRCRQELGLEQDDKKMMIGIVSRLTDQKGFDLIAYVMDELCQEDIQIVVLGTGEERYENMFRHFAWKYQG